MALLEIRGLCLVSGAVRVLDDLDMDVSAGEIHALLGTNGTGKSSLAAAVMGCDGYAPAAGSITFGGTDITAMPLHERGRLGIAMAWQEPVRFEGVGIFQFIALGAKGADAGECLRRTGLSPERYAGRMVDRSLSGGERKRIELAGVLALKPRLAILDEPDSGIDMLSIDDIVSVIRAIASPDAAVLLITHREEIALIADRASQLCHGTIIYTGTAVDVARRYGDTRCATCGARRCR